jgi:uncharacterized protein YndB with AHSA1/START domain
LPHKPPAIDVVIDDGTGQIDVGLALDASGRYTVITLSGVYRELVHGERLVYTQIFEPMREAGEGLITATFEAVDGDTRWTQRELYPSKQVLDGAIASGMERGMRETLEQLDALLPELA